MNYLTQGSQTKERFDLLISLTNIQSEFMIKALELYLVKGIRKVDVFHLVEIDKSNFKKAFDSLNAKAAIVEKIKEIDWRGYRQSENSPPNQ